MPKDFARLHPLKIGLIINPWAGIGGSVALKGSDGSAIRDKAIARGAQPQAQQRTAVALKPLHSVAQFYQLYTVEGQMGGDLLLSLGLKHQNIYHPKAAMTSSADTKAAMKILQGREVDILVFAGGDGTARDIVDALYKPLPVIGIPAGTKIHSAVYCISPHAAGELLVKLLAGEVLDLKKASVMDINEDLFRQGKLRAKQYGELLTPDEPQFVQAAKSAAPENEANHIFDIAEDVVEHMEDEHLYIMGSGRTVAAVMDLLSLQNTLLGIDVLLNKAVIGKDVTANQLLALLKTFEDLPRTLYVTVIGGQGHVFGRGNQQLTAQVLGIIGKYNIQIIASRNKILALAGRPLVSDCGDEEMDCWLAGRWGILVGYHETILYPLV